MKFKVEKIINKDTFNPNPKITLYVMETVNYGIERQSEWVPFNIAFQTVKSAKEYAAKYAEQVYEEEFEL